MPTNILLCCPFCGGEAIVTDYSDPNVNCPGWIAECKSCQAMIDDMYDTKSQAIAAWNRRAPTFERVPDGSYLNGLIMLHGRDIGVLTEGTLDHYQWLSEAVEGGLPPGWQLMRPREVSE